MRDRTELLEAALDNMPDGVALVDIDGQVAFWNRAAAAITGHAGADLLGRPVREALETLIVGGGLQWVSRTDTERSSGRGSLVHVRHRLGHDLATLTRVLVLRDGLGERIGTAALFHPAERLDALPHGDFDESSSAEASQSEVENMLELEFAECARGCTPLGVLWITVDQAHELRKTHGRRACDAMLETVERVLANGLRPGEQVGRWGEDEFLVISHERTPEMLAAHGQVLAGLARTADFRWWGDRVSLTVSVGAAQAERDDPLPLLLQRAQSAMRSSIRAGGNHVTNAQGGGGGTIMFAILGILVVFGAVIGGFLMEKGNLAVLLQPAELLIIAGAATGTLLVANPVHILKGILAGLMAVLSGSKLNTARYLNTLKMMYQFLNKVRKEGLLSVEMDVERPSESGIFKNYPDFLKDHHARDFVCDTLRMAITGGVEPFDMDQMMELDMEVSHREATLPIGALSTVADALPGLGIVAAVLGVVITMGALGGPPEEIGRKVAAALVGTFLGILLCYGVAGPLAANMTKGADEHNCYLHVLRVLMLSFLKGSAPMIAVEIGRRAIPAHVRPSFDQMEKHCKGGGSAESAAAAAA
jgi:chemotaxis protein MotA